MKTSFHLEKRPNAAPPSSVLPSWSRSPDSASDPGSVVAQVWQWTGGRVAACVVPLVLLAGGCALMYAHEEGEALGWLGVAVTVVTLVFVFGHWGRYSDYDGRSTVKLPALVWLFRIVQYVLGALAALFVLSWVLSTVFAS